MDNLTSYCWIIALALQHLFMKQDSVQIILQSFTCCLSKLNIKQGLCEQREINYCSYCYYWSIILVQLLDTTWYLHLGHKLWTQILYMRILVDTSSLNVFYVWRRVSHIHKQQLCNWWNVTWASELNFSLIWEDYYTT